jgi:2-oxoglutarate dehydrogenase complex dehydrogenase (E1) component-like enzyme
MLSPLKLVYKAAQLALKYRNQFNKDIIVDLLCYRRWGHNELDDPSFTQPAMYKIINERKSIAKLFESKLNEENLINKESLSADLKEYRAQLDNSLASVLNGTYKIEPRNTYLKKQW